jgi:methyltransferase
VSVLYVVAGLVAAQRIGELIYAQRNTRRLRERGAVEVAAWQHPLFVALHVSWLVSLVVFIPANTVPNWPLLSVFFSLQAARLWVLASLGPYWTTRIITLPGAPLVRRGPYRFMKHPNYAIVALEIATLPLAFGAWTIAIIFSAANLVLTGARISAENAALMNRT